MNMRIIKKCKQNLILMGVTFVTVVTATACQKIDAIGKGSVKSFDKVLNEIPGNITEDIENASWVLNAPDNSAKFIWSQNFKETDYDAKLEFDAAPFLAAGLDVNQLPVEMVQEDKIVVGINLGEEELSYEGDVTPLASFEQIVNLKRDNIGYHTALDHFGVDLMNGNMFEWASDMSANDKDIVFVLNPEVFMAAGVNPEEVEGWVFAKVETMDEDGKKIEVEKFLKPFDLKK
ncbi:MAG: hypothetical protein K0R21_1079 [Anaerocolumna sp.]|jgi:hypothetical protein|nr:hypothetical protein [Anaerocolumna sp.]